MSVIKIFSTDLFVMRRLGKGALSSADLPLSFMISTGPGRE